MSDSYDNGYAESRERFERETAEHEMTVLHDDGLYRHVRFQKPGESFYYYDLVTWPGRLVVCGDCGDFMFSRLTDMFEFFAGSNHNGQINPPYWAEKLRGDRHGSDMSRRFSRERFVARVAEWHEDMATTMSEGDAAELREALDAEVLANDYGDIEDEHSAFRALADFAWRRTYIDATEWDLRDFDWAFLWCCWAIVRGIERYRSAVPA